jgi:hypothetical protein
MMALGAATLLLAIRAVVLTVGEDDPSVLEGVRAMGADTVVTFARPSAAASAAAGAAGLAYVPFLSVRDIDRLLFDPDALVALRAIPGIAGFHYMDEDVVEGYTPPEEQARAYAILKALFPGALVLIATRLDPVASDPGYLDGYFRPEDTDLVAPYFYPVGTTPIGDFTEQDGWEERLASLLVPIAARMPAGKAVLPVLQAFEQEGFPVGPELAARQFAVYQSVWPDTADIAAFWWGGGAANGLAGLSQRPELQDAFTRLFLGLAPRRPVRVVPERPSP